MLKTGQVYKPIFLSVPHEQHCNFLLPLTPQQELEKGALFKQISVTNLEIYYIPECFQMPNIKLLNRPS